MGSPLPASKIWEAMRGVRSVTGDALTLMQKRLPDLGNKRQLTDDVMAVDPLEVVLGGYIDGRGEAALERALMAQYGQPLQYLDEGRWFDNRAAGVTGREMPLLTYPGKTIPGTRGGILGLFRFDDRPRASIQVAAGGQYPGDVLAEEARHAIDRNMVPNERAASFRSPDAFASLLGVQPYDRAKAFMDYYALPSETRATLSGMLAESPDFINTPQQATDLLERVREAGNVRERATAEGILNSKALRNEYIPYLMKALSAGGVMAGTNSQENRQ